MAWNRSKESLPAATQRKASARRSLVRRAAVVGLVIVAGALGCFLLFDKGDVQPPSEETTPPKETHNSAKTSPGANIATNRAPVVKEKEPKLKPGEKRYVQWKRPDNWDRLTRAEKTRIQPVGRVVKPIGWDERKLFTKPSDQKVERLLRVTPGQLVLGTMKYDQRFVNQFLDSLKEPIEFADEDSEEDRAMKQAVIDVRADLKAAYDRGENIAEIMSAAEKEAHELAAYKLDLRQLLVDYKQSGEHSDQEVKDYIKAADKMLVDRGMEPLRLGEIWYHKAKFDSKVNPK